MAVNSIRDILALSGQYHRETGNYITCRNSIHSLEEFYQRRNIIGRLVFEELRSKGYNLTNRRTLELFANIYDSIGQNFDTYIVDSNTSSLRENSSNHLISEFDDYNIYMHNGQITIRAIETIKGVHRTYKISHEINPNSFRCFTLFNPRNKNELSMMRELLNSRYKCIVGFFGEQSDLDIRRHQIETNNLEENTNGVIIPNISVDNGYAYVLTNRQRRNWKIG